MNKISFNRSIKEPVPFAACDLPLSQPSKRLEKDINKIKQPTNLVKVSYRNWFPGVRCNWKNARDIIRPDTLSA